MTTLAAISSSAAANREFWTDRARMYLAAYRSHSGKPTLAAERARMRDSFRECLAARRSQLYLNP